MMNSITLETADSTSLEAAEHNPSDSNPAGSVLLAHGITQDMSESNDIFLSLAESLVDNGYSVVRFSYRGHGNSEGEEAGATIAGECLDFKEAFDYIVREHESPHFVVAASFGAVSTCLSLPYLEDDLSGAIMWNPVLDLDATFINPYLPWGEDNFTGDNLQHLMDEGYLLIDGSFELGRVMYDEMKWYKPHKYFRQSSIPSIVLHGDRDDLVPLDVSKDMAEEKTNCEFELIKDSAHGFKESNGSRTTKEIHQEVIETTTNWLNSHTQI